MKKLLSLVVTVAAILNAPSPVHAADTPDDKANSRRVPADQPMPRFDKNSQIAHEQLLEKTKKGTIDVYFVGDSITRRWGALDYPKLVEHWNKTFRGWNAANFAWGGDNTRNIIWRLDNGELEGVQPKVYVVMAGTNNLGERMSDGEKVADITKGVEAIVERCRKHSPDAQIILTAMFPRNDRMAYVPVINRINENLAVYAEENSIRFLNINGKLADADGVLREGMTVDKLHLGEKGYDVWAETLVPVLTEILGPPAETDTAPPLTGDPSAQR